MSKAPAKNPCDSCPYRKDVPPGVWDHTEYLKLSDYDKETGEQPIMVFQCHQRTGRLCAGWAGCHDMRHSLSLRLAHAWGHLTDGAMRATVNYRTDVPLWSSGREAALHGLKGCKGKIPKAAKVLIAKLVKRLDKIKKP